MGLGRAFAIALALAGLAAAASPPPAAAQDNHIVFATDGVPPVFSMVIIYVAEKEGFFKKYGVDVKLRGFDSGAAAGRAIVAGDIDFGLPPTPVVIDQIANAGVNLVAIYGLPNPDFVLGTTKGDKATCKDVAGQAVGVDTPGGARSLALKDMLVGCHLKITDVQQVGLGSNSAAALIAGQISYAVLHLDDIPNVETHGKKVSIVTSLAKTNPTSHYLIGVARRDRLQQKRPAYVGVVAALIEAARFMNDPKNADTVAKIATVTGHDEKLSRAALERYLAMDFWPPDDNGLGRKKLEAVAADQLKVGNIKPGKTPPSYAQLVDLSVWKDANALVSKH